MKKQYSYSQDKDFLHKIDTLLVQEQWAKITLLEYNSEQPLMEIEGEISSGTLNKDGSSAVRRTCSFTCNVDAFTYDPEDIKSKYSISKKIYLELGVTNDTDQYPEEKVIWFPQGVMFISSFAINSSATGATTINVQFKDKMAMLDGTVGGVLPATTRFDTVTSIVNGVTKTTKVLVYDIIMEAVNHFGGEDLSNIIIDDVPKKAKRIIKWNSSSPIWIYPIQGGNDEISYDVCFTSDLDEKKSAHTPIEKNGSVFSATQYTQNQDIGYTYEDFVYDDELTFSAGSKITDVLDKIKNWLGNYEYFYDEYGQFHFQEIKNYLNNRQSGYIWNKIQYTDDQDYLCDPVRGEAVYAFNDDENLVSITNTPLYSNIKNDFIVEGKTDKNGIKSTVRYHLVIDNKPSINTDGYDNVLIYQDPLTGNYTAGMPTIVEPHIATVQDDAMNPSNFELVGNITKTKSSVKFNISCNIVATNGYKIAVSDKEDSDLEWVTKFTVKNDVEYHISIKPFEENTDIESILSNVYLTADDGYIWELPEFAEDGRIYGLFDEPQLFSFKKKINNLEHFKTHYDSLVNTENEVIDKENKFKFRPKMQDYLLTFLINLMSEELGKENSDTRETILTLGRFLQRYYVKNIPVKDDSVEKKYYYKVNSGFYEADKAYREIPIESNLKKAVQQATLVEILHSIFDESIGDYDKDKVNKYYSDEYWPSIGTKPVDLWVGLENLEGKTDEQIISARSKWITSQLDIIANKRKQLDIISDSYKQILGNYTALIKNYERKIKKGTATESDIKWKDLTTQDKEAVQQQIDYYTEEINLSVDRTTALYAILTFMGVSDKTEGETYVTIDVVAPAYVTSFWYYDTDTSKETYGWNKLNWYAYYKNNDPQPKDKAGNRLAYYHNGKCSSTYIDYTNISMWDDFDYSLNSKVNEDYNMSFQRTGDGIDYLVIDNEFFKVEDDISIDGSNVKVGKVTGGEAVTRFTSDFLNGTRNVNPNYYWEFSDSYPSMNKNSDWYKLYYTKYAEDNKLQYFEEGRPDGYVPTDWRVELILRGMNAVENGTDPGDYYQELVANWPATYDFRNEYLVPNKIVDVDYFVDTTAVLLDDGFYFDRAKEIYGILNDEDAVKIKDTTLEIEKYHKDYNNSNYHYFFDMIDASSSRWGEYSVGNIGRRTNVNVSDSVNCIFSPDTPNYAFINVSGMTQKQRADALTELRGVAENIIQVTDDFYNNFATGGMKQSAYEQIKYDLQKYTSYQNTVSLTARPSFYLNPNVRVDLYDESTGTIGDYVIKTISIPLGSTGSNMSVSLSKALERI